MKILIISPGIIPVTGSHGGAVEYLIDMYLQYNEEKKDSITVYSVSNKQGFYDKNIYRNTKFRVFDRNKTVYKIKNRIFKLCNKELDGCINSNFIRNVVLDLKRRHEENYYDLIVFENGHEFIRYFRKKINTKSKLVLHLHNDYINVDMKDSYVKKSLFDEIWPVSNYLKNRISEIDGKNDNIKVIHNTVDYDTLEKSKLTEQTLAKQAKKTGLSDKFAFIYVGRVLENKGILELVKAFLKFNKKHADSTLIIVGGDWNQSDGELFFQRIKKLSEKNKNIIMTGHLNNFEAVKYYQFADVQIIPSKVQEAFGLICLEGMFFNLPIIASDVGAIREVCSDNVYYVNPQNLTKDLYSAMNKVYLNYDEAKKKTEKYDEVLSAFSKDKYLKTFYSYCHD